ncbi:16S rRNA (guanine(527)-N(7))-methyltransferase RsmG [Thiohalomonas denitrificans]|uniref:16S rRNA (guanine(527)-N(7))-methyltransferase RsmG n=1 Tax=Thiohalomonas denitrificans TaxID=415747 RepID=UPI0026E9F3D5|nr:16S rRNA (guanine(527)-N(7))-methyltransferase RsmG [Thiohalomonas denitrificans]
MTLLNQSLATGLEAMGLALSEAQRELLIAYVGLLAKWNRAYNLTAVREPQEMVVRHLLDSLAVAPYLAQGRDPGDALRVIDVGTGPGLPGIPLAVACPGDTFFLLDTNGKKTRFLTQAKAELGLGNVTVIHSRVEAYRPDTPFDVVIARAFASLSEIASGCSHLLAPRGRVLAMKGARPEAELAALPAGLSAQAIRLTVPGLEQEQRHLIVISNE